MRSRAMPLTGLAAAILVLIAGGCGDHNEARVASSPTAQAPTPVPTQTRKAGSENPLDLGTASVLAEDLAWAYTDGDAAEVQRCVQMTVARVDCDILYSSEAGEADDSVHTVAMARRGERLVGAFYQIDVPQDNALVGLGRLHAKVGSEWDPAGLISDDVGYGRPKLKGLLRKQCALQPCGKR